MDTKTRNSEVKKDPPKEAPKEAPKDKPKEQPKDAPKEQPKEQPKDGKKEEKKEDIRDKLEAPKVFQFLKKGDYSVHLLIEEVRNLTGKESEYIYFIII
jgi:hypothetical protein